MKTLLGLILIVMFVDLILMYGWSEGGVSNANRHCSSDFATISLFLFLWNVSYVALKA
jgi:hypothetical protein